jgi:hypothetical protein
MLVAHESSGAKPMTMFDRITSNPTILNEQPTIRGMHLSARRVIQALAARSGLAEVNCHIAGAGRLGRNYSGVGNIGDTRRLGLLRTGSS